MKEARLEEKVRAVSNALPSHNGLPFRLFQGRENVTLPFEAREGALGAGPLTGSS